MSRSDRRCWVVKVGSALLTDLESGLNRNLIAQLVGELAELRREGVDVVVRASNTQREVLLLPVVSGIAHVVAGLSAARITK